MPPVMSKPAASHVFKPVVPVPSVRIVSTPRTSCICGGLLCASGQDTDAVIYSLAGAEFVKHTSKRCTSKQCRKYFYYNFCTTDEGGRVNTVLLSQVDYLFVTPQTGFEKKFLEYHSMLHFRGYISAGAIAFAAGEVLFSDSNLGEFWWAKTFRDAQFLRMVMQELFEVQKSLVYEIIIGDELSAKALRAYDDYMHRVGFLPANPDDVKELCGDGHEKVLVKLCCDDEKPKKRSGPPSSKRSTAFPYNNGWFMAVNPTDGRVLGVQEQFEPENNQVVIDCLNRVLPGLPQCNCFIYDRVCRLAPEIERKELFEQVKYWVVDKFHAHGHSCTCRHSPLTVIRLKRRVSKVNTAISEQVFSWFRNYARTFNEMRKQRHHFLVLYFSKLHNALVDQNKTSYLNPHSTVKQLLKSRKNSRSYACTPVRKVQKKKSKNAVMKSKKAVMKAKKAVMKVKRAVMKVKTSAAA
jgi:hypothetical protein